MDDLVEWLRAQLVHDERVALAVPERERGWRHDVIPDSTGPDHVLLIGDRVVSVGFFEDDPLRPAEAEHIIGHDPARVLREVEAKRRRLQRHQPVEDWVGHDHMPAGRRLIGVNCSTCRDGTCGDDYDIYCAPIAWPCPEIRDDLSVYSDRPGYQESWRP